VSVRRAESRLGAPKPGRRPYDPPQVASVDLKADEVLGNNCKNAYTPGPAGGICTANNCSLGGS
jgi:hypothetical protein